MAALLILWIIVVVVGALYGLVIGLRAFGRGLRYDDQYAYTLHFLAINVCEPIISMSLILGFLMFGGLSVSNSSLNVVGAWLGSATEWFAPLLITAPMTVLLSPAIGLFFSQRRYRRLSVQILWLGLLRWGINLLVFYLLIALEGAGVLPAILLVLGGTVVLWLSVLWAQDQLNGALHEPESGVAQTAIA